VKHKGWHSRGYLPHLDAPGLIQAVTFRLADALPASVLKAWRMEDLEDEAMRRRVAAYLDSGRGSCCLGDPRAARVVADHLLTFKGERYRLHAWVVMPNHVHAVVETFDGWPLGNVVGYWKGSSARAINRVLGLEGRLWQPGYFDRYIRDEEHLHRAVLYVVENPVRAGLVQKPEDWVFSSAGWRGGNHAG